MGRIVLIAAIGVISAAPFDLSGAWEFEVDLGGIEIETNCNLSQDGSKLAGRCWATAGPYRYDTDATGTVDGDRMELSYWFPSDRGSVTFHYKGGREPDSSLAGDCTIVTGDKGDTARCIFTAARTR